MILSELLVRRQGANHSDGACHPFSLPKGGTIIFNSSFSIVLDHNAVYEPLCPDGTRPEPVGPATILDLQDPFYASTSPQMYAIGAATVISYLLVIMLFITPRTFFIGGHGGGFLSRRGMISGSYGSSSVVGVGGRPWLQKVAALTVAISLTIVTADSFRVANDQYVQGYMDSSALTNEVLNGVEIRIIRVVSSTFLWLAQVQTLIRLFPRHKEKVIIKWVGFALIVLDIVFTILNNFVNGQSSVFQPRHIVDAIPALNYLFDLSLSLLYAAWVIFYSLSKHRFAFFHVKMKNICLVALLSLVAILIPVIFFIVDLSKPTLAAWGEYIRWVGAAAASVVVWEWVERIEALEREERKDGVLGREIFDGDEMLEITPSEEVDWPGCRRHGGKGAGDGEKRGGGGGGAAVETDAEKRSKTSSGWADVIGLSNRPLRSRVTFASRLARPRRKTTANQSLHPRGASTDRGPVSPSPPVTLPQAVTPVSRADTTSAASTVYRVRYHSVVSSTPSILGRSDESESVTDGEKELSTVQSRDSHGRSAYDVPPGNGPSATLLPGRGWLRSLFRRRGSPPHEVATAQAAEEGNIIRVVPTPSGPIESKGWSLRSAAGTVLSTLHLDWGRSSTAANDVPRPLPVTVIPAPPRREYRRPSASRTRDVAPTHAHSGDVRPLARHGVPARAHGTESLPRGDSLPVMVIPARPRPSMAAWSSSGLDEAPLADASSPADQAAAGTVATSERERSVSFPDQHPGPVRKSSSGDPAASSSPSPRVERQPPADESPGTVDHPPPTDPPPPPPSENGAGPQPPGAADGRSHPAG